MVNIYTIEEDLKSTRLVIIIKKKLNSLLIRGKCTKKSIPNEAGRAKSALSRSSPSNRQVKRLESVLTNPSRYFRVTYDPPTYLITKILSALSSLRFIFIDSRTARWLTMSGITSTKISLNMLPRL